jgi:hypothetical protein
MSEFKRGLNDKALQLVDEFLKSKVGIRIIEKKDMFICIRDNYINVYLNGCSLLKYAPLATKNKFLIHHKYLELEPLKSDNPYLPLKYVDGDLEYNGKSYIKDVIDNPSDGLKHHITNADDAKEPGEKALLAKLISNAVPRPFLIDLEVAFTRERTSEELAIAHIKKETATNSIDKVIKNTVADRIDLAVLAKSNGRLVLRMIEVKIDYDGRLKSRAEGKQEILNQMDNYKTKFLKAQSQSIITSYKRVAENYKFLGITNMFSGSNPAHTLQQFIDNCEISIDKNDPSLVLDMDPHLLLILSPNEENSNRITEDHLQKLQSKFKGPMAMWSTKNSDSLDIFSLV